MNHSHVIDSWIAELGLEARALRRARAERQELGAAAGGGSSEPGLGFGSVAAPIVVAGANRGFTEPRLVPRFRGDRARARFAGARVDGVRPCLGAA
jgi:hypothetical protein